MTRLQHDQIAKRSYLIWEQAGRPDGQHIEHWLQAEAELAHLYAPKSAPDKAAPKKAAPKKAAAKKASGNGATKAKPAPAKKASVKAASAKAATRKAAPAKKTAKSRAKTATKS